MLPTEFDFAPLLEYVKDIIPQYERDDALQIISEILRENVPHYDWVGFYIVEDKPDVLELGPYAGDPTEHTQIPFGRGICGQAAIRKETFIVQDVTQEKNYLSCSTAVMSEIVVPIFSAGKVIGELDIDSHSRAPFKEEDKQFLETVALLVATLF